MSASIYLRRAVGAAALGVACLLAPPAEADSKCGDQTHHNDCGNKPNIYPCCANGGNCTWWAWESVCRNWHVGLVNWGNANTWASHAKTDPKYDVVSYAVVGSIATRKSGNYGHVAWVTDISGSNVTVTEENCCSNCGYGLRKHTYAKSYFDSGYVVKHGACKCQPGKKETQTCGDCGTQTRKCKETCDWGDWSACDGADPGGGTQACDTGADGVCGEGVAQCVAGAAQCAAVSKASDELCDGLDNDCNGATDDGFPQELGATPPDYAAALVEASYPGTLAVGEKASAWVDFRNVGKVTWSKGAVQLAAPETSETEPSPYFQLGSWVSWDVPASLDKDVAPGEVGRFSFDMTGPDAAGTVIKEAFQLRLPDGSLLGCPSPEITTSIEIVKGAAAGASGAGGAGGSATAGSSGTGQAGSASDAGSAGNGGSGAKGGSAGNGGAGAKAGTSGVALPATVDSPASEESAGCTCTTTGGDGPAAPRLALLLGAAGLVARGARRRRAIRGAASGATPRG
jgi:MYXO-CTERM domain-containing protein